MVTIRCINDRCKQNGDCGADPNGCVGATWYDACTQDFHAEIVCCGEIE
jgi:hypothetical protein